MEIERNINRRPHLIPGQKLLFGPSLILWPNLVPGPNLILGPHLILEPNPILVVARGGSYQLLLLLCMLGLCLVRFSCLWPPT